MSTGKLIHWNPHIPHSIEAERKIEETRELDSSPLFLVQVMRSNIFVKLFQLFAESLQPATHYPNTLTHRQNRNKNVDTWTWVTHIIMGVNRAEKHRKIFSSVFVVVLDKLSCAITSFHCHSAIHNYTVNEQPQLCKFKNSQQQNANNMPLAVATVVQTHNK